MTNIHSGDHRSLQAFKQSHDSALSLCDYSFLLGTCAVTSWPYDQNSQTA